jgi:hypothetical protein
VSKFKKNQNYVEPYYTDEMKFKITQGLMTQVIKNDIGASVSAIIDRVKNKQDSTLMSRPYNSSDFGQCYRLIEQTGIIIECMYGVSIEWESIVNMWEPLCKSYLKKDGSFYHLLQKIVNGGLDIYA